MSSKLRAPAQVNCRSLARPVNSAFKYTSCIPQARIHDPRAMYFARRPTSHEPATCAVLSIPGRCKTRSYDSTSILLSLFDEIITRLSSVFGAPHPTRIPPADPPASNAKSPSTVDPPCLGAFQHPRTHPGESTAVDIPQEGRESLRRWVSLGGSTGEATVVNIPLN